MREKLLLTCDTCGLQATKDELEFQEVICIQHVCGYGSIHVYDEHMTIDMCGDHISFSDSKAVNSTHPD